VQQSKVGMVLRVIPQVLPTIDTLGVPQVLKEVVMSKRGLCILVGATGSGKSTTLAAISLRNQNSYGPHHHHQTRGIRASSQELRGDAARGGAGHRQLEAALKNTLRQAPDVILMGEIRDPRDHGACDRLRRNGPPVHGDAARQQRQPGARPGDQLLPGGAPRPAADGPVAEPEVLHLAAPGPKQDGKGRAAAVEILLNSPLVSDLIFKGEVSEIKEIMKKSRNLGMQTFDQALFDMYENNIISYEDALRNADSVNDLRLQIKLNSQRAKSQDLSAGTEHLAIV